MRFFLKAKTRIWAASRCSEGPLRIEVIVRQHRLLVGVLAKLHCRREHENTPKPMDQERTAAPTTQKTNEKKHTPPPPNANAPSKNKKKTIGRWPKANWTWFLIRKHYTSKQFGPSVCFELFVFSLFGCVCTIAPPPKKNAAQTTKPRPKQTGHKYLWYL